MWLDDNKVIRNSIDELHESRQDDDFDPDLFIVHDGNDPNENTKKIKMSEAKVLKLNTIEEEILESKGFFEDPSNLITIRS